jgi:hypothetical protein
VQTLQSPEEHGNVELLFQFLFSGTSFQPGRFGAKMTARFGVHRTGCADADAATCSSFKSHSSTASFTQRAMRSDSVHAAIGLGAEFVAFKVEFGIEDAGEDFG